MEFSSSSSSWGSESSGGSEQCNLCKDGWMFRGTYKIMSPEFYLALLDGKAHESYYYHILY
jgi:hypothetical protein